MASYQTNQMKLLWNSSISMPVMSAARSSMLQHKYPPVQVSRHYRVRFKSCSLADRMKRVVCCIPPPVLMCHLRGTIDNSPQVALLSARMCNLHFLEPVRRTTPVDWNVYSLGKTLNGSAFTVRHKPNNQMRTVEGCPFLIVGKQD